ncbi:MAG: hypothetical protein HN509_05445 [Halobacteriovoraceae bacterium]|jgi:hypothetical protein|nr:hypothetical protein [Halobacteriovoraceae bacterium]MBT5093081.1 hypothetical protein [Halobacteriovoraceae bacterium]
MSIFKMSVACFVLLFAGTAIAKSYDFNLETATVVADVPNRWTPMFYQNGIPLTFISPMLKGAGRATISIVPTGHLKVWYPPEIAFKSWKKLQQDHRKWLNGMKGKLIKFDPYVVEKWTGVLISHNYTWSYKLAGKEWIASERKIICEADAQMYHMTTLHTKAHEKKFAKQMNKIIKSFHCKKLNKKQLDRIGYQPR